MSDSSHWASIAETGTTLGMRFLIFAYRVGGRGLFKLFLFPVMLFYFVLRADSRRASREYLQRVSCRMENYPPVDWRLVFAHFWQFGLALIDKFAIWMGKLGEADLVMHNRELIEELVAQGKGGVFAISHLGNFEIISAMSQTHEGVKLTVLQHTHHAEKFNKLLTTYTSAARVEFLQVTDMDMALAIRLSERTGNGEFVAIAADRVPISEQSSTIGCEFFGDTAPFPAGPHVLAYVLNVAVIALFCVREGDLYHIYFEQIAEPAKQTGLSREEFVRQSAERFARRLEHHTRRQPLQWFNFYDFWQADKRFGLSNSET